MDAFEYALLAAAALVAASLAATRGKWGTAARDRPPSPESRIHVTADDAGIACTYPDGGVMNVAWPDITSVEIRTTPCGPWLADVFWEVFVAEDTRAVVYPNGATGERAVLDAMATRLPGLDHRAVGAAMACTTGRIFTVWRKTSTT